MYKLLALDLDGTLLRHDGVVDERDRAAIAEVRAAGVTVTIVTGRLHSGALGAARACAIEGAIACMEGSHLVEVGGATIAHHAIAPEIGAVLHDAFADLATFVFDRDGIHHDHAGAPYAHYVATWSPNLRVVEAARAWPEIYKREALAAVAIGAPEAVAAALPIVRAQPLFSASFAVSAAPGMHAILVRAAGPSKGTALAELCATAGCSLAEAVAVGDWVNDVPMFRVAGRSFAMGMAPEAVAAAATDQLVRPAGSGGGIAEAIRRAWG